MFIVIAYDIPDNKRRTRLYKTLQRFGSAVQYSVFEFELTPSQFEQLQKAVARVVNPKADRVRYYELCEGCRRRIRSIGKMTNTEIEPVYVVSSARPRVLE
jgi:CRISPR-associated protein Cas2